MRNVSIYVFLFFGVLAVGSAFYVFAHSAGQSFEREVGEYLLDIGASNLTLRASAPIAFDFNILRKDTREPAPFTNIWLRFEDNNKLLFAGGIAKASFGRTTVTYAFPRGGAYTLAVRFQNGDDSLAEVTIPLMVEQSVASEGADVSSLKTLAAGAVGGFAIGFIAAYVLSRKKFSNV